jgi:predicted alpha/beta hydrolase family esterase
MSATLVFVPGIGNSGPEHWQSSWARETPGAIWVEQADWDRPVRDAWVAALEGALRRAPGPTVLVAHSLGCLTVAEAGPALQAAGVRRAFLVAVPDTTGPGFPAEVVGFRHAHALHVPVPSMVVASSDDPYSTLGHAEEAARRWGSRFVAVGARGHINARSGLGAWPEGRSLLDAFAAER